MQPTRLLLPFLLATATLAQEADESPSARSKRITWPMVTMSFAGGTMTEFVAAVRAAQPKANIVVAEAAAQAALPAIQIKDAGLDQVLESACAVATAADRIRCSEANGRGEPVFAIMAQPASRGVTTVTGAGGGGSDEETVVLSLNRLTTGQPELEIAGLSVETILSAVEAGSYFDKKPAMMRYHRDSGLLFLRGSHRQLGLASDVLKILERDHLSGARAAGASRQSPAGADGAAPKGRDR